MGLSEKFPLEVSHKFPFPDSWISLFPHTIYILFFKDKFGSKNVIRDEPGIKICKRGIARLPSWSMVTQQVVRRCNKPV